MYGFIIVTNRKTPLLIPIKINIKEDNEKIFL